MTSHTPDALSSLESPRLLDRERDLVRRLGFAKRTEQPYVHWIKRFVLFHGKRHSTEPGKPEADAFLTSLVVERNVVTSSLDAA